MFGDVVCDPVAVEATPAVAAIAEATDDAAPSPFAGAVPGFVDCPADELSGGFRICCAL